MKIEIKNKIGTYFLFFEVLCLINLIVISLLFNISDQVYTIYRTNIYTKIIFVVIIFLFNSLFLDKLYTKIEISFKEKNETVLRDK